MQPIGWPLVDQEAVAPQSIFECEYEWYGML